MNDTSGRPAPRARKLLCLVLAAAAPAVAAAAAEGAAEYREHVMESIGGHMQAAADILRQKVPHQDHLRLHVNALADMAGIAHTLFPEGSEGGDALPAIWSNADDFASRLADFEAAAGDLKVAVSNGSDVGATFQKLGQACKSCHDNYRDD